MTSETTTNLSRRQVIRRGAAAGAVVWAAPMVVSSTAHATGGSSGATSTGKLDSVTCVWDRSFFQPNRGTSLRPRHDYSNDAFCKINVGEGWTTLARHETFTIASGQTLRFRPWRGHSGGRTAEPDTDTPTPEPVNAQAEVFEDATPTTDPPTTPESEVPAAPTNISTFEEPKVTDDPATGTEQGPDETTATTTSVPVEDEDTDLEPVDEEPVDEEPVDEELVDTIVIDMSGRTPITIGDVYGYFRIVDAVPA